MGHSIQIVNKRAYIFYDLDVLVAIHVMAKEAVRCENASLLDPLMQKWRNQLDEYTPGAIDLYLDQIASNKLLAQAFGSCVRNVLSRLQNDSLSLPVLIKSLNVDGVQINPSFPKLSIEKVLERFLEVLPE